MVQQTPAAVPLPSLPHLTLERKNATNSKINQFPKSLDPCSP